MTKIAMAVVHGVGKQDPDFHRPLVSRIKERFAGKLQGLPNCPEHPELELVDEPVYWAPVLHQKESRLWDRVTSGFDLDYVKLRHFMIDFAADAIAYQPLPNHRDIYDQIHVKFARALNRLAKPEAAGVKAPLCVIAHSLGTVIASNYLYDLDHDFQRKSKDGEQNCISEEVGNEIGDAPLEKGETLTLFFTMGSPIAIWSLRYERPLFGQPIKVPARRLRRHYSKTKYPDLEGEWINIFDEDDVIGYPLKALNSHYTKAVTKDLAVNAGGLLSSWNPLSHNSYWKDRDVIRCISDRLVSTWKAVNP